MPKYIVKEGMIYNLLGLIFKSILKGAESKALKDLKRKDPKFGQKLQQLEKDKKDIEDSEKGAAGNGADGDVQIVSITNQNYDEAIQKQVDGDASSRSYVKLPKVNLKNMIIPYKEYIRDFAKDNAKLYGEDKEGLKYAHDEADKFLKESSSVVNYLVKEFEMKKNS